MDDADRSHDGAIKTPGDAERDGGEADARPAASAPSGGRTAADAKPRKRPGRPKGSKTTLKEPAKGAPADEVAKQEKKELRALKKKLAGVLSGPSMVLEPWPASHVERSAPDVADALVKLAEDDPVLRRRMLKFFEGGAVGNLIFAAGVYLVPILAYYGAPAPAIVHRAFSIPNRRELLATGRPAEPHPMPQPATPEAMEQEATARGFENVEDYIEAAQRTGSWDIRALRAYGPPPQTAEPQGS